MQTLSGPEMRKLLRSLFGSKTLGATRPSILGRSCSSSWRILRPRNVSSNPEDEGITAKMIKRFKSTCRSFSKRIAAITIMHGPYERWKPSTGVWQGLRAHRKRGIYDAEESTGRESGGAIG